MKLNLLKTDPPKKQEQFKPTEDTDSVEFKSLFKDGKLDTNIAHSLTNRAVNKQNSETIYREITLSRYNRVATKLKELVSCSEKSSREYHQQIGSYSVNDIITLDTKTAFKYIFTLFIEKIETDMNNKNILALVSLKQNLTNETTFDLNTASRYLSVILNFLSKYDKSTHDKLSSTLTILHKSNHFAGDIHLLDSYSLTMYALITNKQIENNDASNIIDAFSFIIFKHMGISPWNVFNLDDSQLKIISTANQKLLEAITDEYKDISDMELSKLFTEETIIDMQNYIISLWDAVICDSLLEKDMTVMIDNIHLFISKDSFLKDFIVSTITNLVFDNQTDNSLILKTNLENIYYGDEVEFLIADQYRHNTLLDLWVQLSKENLAKLNISDTQFEYDTLDTGLKVIHRIGAWSYCVFVDITTTLEVTPAPYKQDQIYEIKDNNGNITAYKTQDAYDTFIIPIMKQLDCEPVSTHKHLDIQALNGNVELLFRILVDCEQNSWFPMMLGREQSSIEWFPFVVQKKPYFQTLLTNVIEQTNRMVEDNNYCSKSGSFTDLAIFADKLNSCLPLFSKYSPCNTSHIKLDKPQTIDLKIKPTSTIEYRFFLPCKTGRELDLINKMLCARISYLEDCQKKKKPLIYNAISPFSYTKENILANFKKYLSECNLEYDEYKWLLDSYNPDQTKTTLNKLIEN